MCQSYGCIVLVLLSGGNDRFHTVDPRPQAEESARRGVGCRGQGSLTGTRMNHPHPHPHPSPYPGDGDGPWIQPPVSESEASSSLDQGIFVVIVVVVVIVHFVR